MFPANEKWLAISVGGQPMTGRSSEVLRVVRGPTGKAVLTVLDRGPQVPVFVEVEADQDYAEVSAQLRGAP